MKRKSFVEFHSSPSKSRRLDCDLLDEPRSLVSKVLEPKQLASSSIDNGVSSPAERALVLYDPANTPFLRSPISPDFAAILNSDLIPGLRDLIFLPGKSNRVKSMENKLSTGKTAQVSNNSLAIVSCVPSQLAQISLSQPMEAEVAAEMMDLDDVSCIGNSRNTSEFGGKRMMIVTEGLQFRQQQHSIPTEFLQDKNSLGNNLLQDNKYTRVSW